MKFKENSFFCFNFTNLVLIVTVKALSIQLYPGAAYSCRNYKRSKNGRFPITVAGNYIRPPDIVAATMSELLRYKFF